MSFMATGGAGITGVRVEEAVWPKMSVTLYVSAVFVPCVALTSATKVTTPVDVFNVYVPSPAMVTTPSASHVVVLGVIRQVTEVLKPTPEVASPLAPVNVVKVAVPPGITAFDSGVAIGTAGIETVGVIVALVIWPVVSATTYFTGDAVPNCVGALVRHS